MYLHTCRKVNSVGPGTLDNVPVRRRGVCSTAITVVKRGDNGVAKRWSCLPWAVVVRLSQHHGKVGNSVNKSSIECLVGCMLSPGGPTSGRPEYMWKEST